MKYKIGDKVWIRSDINFGLYPGTDTHYQINNGEKDIRGKEVEINYLTDGKSYGCKEYKGFHYLMIDESKTQPITDVINYEIY